MAAWKKWRTGLYGLMLVGLVTAGAQAQMPADTQFINDIRDKKYSETLPYLVNGNSPNVRDYNGVPAIVAAAEIGDAGMVKELLKYGANPNMVNRQDGATAMHRAAARGSDIRISVLVVNGADIDPIDGLGETPLIKAVKEGNLKATEMLLSINANPNFTDYTGHSAYDHAMRSRDWRIKKLFQ